MQHKMIKGVLAATAAMAAIAPAHAEAGDWLVRLRAILVAPQGTSGDISGLPGSNQRVKAGNAVVPELDITYMWTKNIGTELILGTSKHSIKGTGALDGVGKLASTYALPPTLTLQYHFAPDGPFRPYVGVGANYTIFYSAKASSILENGVGAGPTKVHLKDSFGYALQGGFDIPVGKRSFINLDLKYVDMNSNARLVTTNVDTLRVKAHVDPIIAGVGYGLRF